MLYLNPESKEISQLKEIHFNAVRCFVRKRLGSTLKCSCAICEGKVQPCKNLPLEMRTILEDEHALHKLILSKPKELKQEHDNIFRQLFPNHSIADIHKIISRRKKYDADQKKEPAMRKGLLSITPEEKLILRNYELLGKVFDYENWFNKLDAHTEYGPYALAKGLAMRSCTYCNRQYTLTIASNSTSGKLTRPQFDHWYSKDKYPLLGLSFYNLIPSCVTCNSSVKGNAVFEVDSNIHPYHDDYIDQIQFRFEYWEMLDQYRTP